MEFKKYMKRPLEVEAIQYTGDNLEAVKALVDSPIITTTHGTGEGPKLRIGVFTDSPILTKTDWVIKDVDRVSIIPNDIFIGTYLETEAALKEFAELGSKKTGGFIEFEDLVSPAVPPVDTRTDKQKANDAIKGFIQNMQDLAGKVMVAGSAGNMLFTVKTYTGLDRVTLVQTKNLNLLKDADDFGEIVMDMIDDKSCVLDILDASDKVVGTLDGSDFYRHQTLINSL